MKLRPITLKTLLDVLNNYRYCFLRNYEILPVYENDIDILIDPKIKNEVISQLVKQFSEIGVVRLQRVEFSCTAIFFYDTISHQFLHIDFFDVLKWKVFQYLDTYTILNSRKKHRNFYIPDPEHECLELLFTRLIYHGKIKDKYKEKIFCLANQLNQVTHNTQHIFREILSKAKDNKWSDIEQKKFWIRTFIIGKNLLHPVTLTKSILLLFKRGILRIFRNPGLFITFYGPDGSGKSTQINFLKEHIRKMYSDKIRLFHFRTHLSYRPPSDIIVSDPHDQPDTGLFRSTIKLLFYLFIYQWGFWTQIKPMLVNNGLVIFDRYYHDILVDPIRYRFTGSLWMAKQVSKLMPKPDIIILLDAPAEVLQARKKEMAFEETHRQREAYRGLVQSLSNSVIVDASKSLEEVNCHVEIVIVEYLYNRQKALEVV